MMAPKTYLTGKGVLKRKSTSKNNSRKACYSPDSAVDVIQRLENSIIDILQSRDPGKTC